MSAADLVKNENFESKDILGLIGTNGSPKFTYSELYVNGTSGRALSDLVAAAIERREEAIAINSLYSSPHLSNTKLGNAGFQADNFYQAGLPGLFKSLPEQANRFHIDAATYKRELKGLSYKAIYEEGQNPLINDTGSHQWLSAIIKTAQRRNEEIEAIKDLQNLSNELLSTSDIVQFGEGSDNYYSFSLSALASAGISIQELIKNKDFSNKELLSIKDTDGVTAKFTYKDLYNNGYGRDLAGLVATALTNNQAEAAINSLKSVEHKYLGEADLVKYGEGDSSINGFTANDLAQAGIAASVLVQNKDFSNKELLSIKDTDGVTAKFTYKDLYNRGYGRDLAGLVATALANNQAEAAINSLKSVEHKYLGEADLVKYGEGDSSINGFTANDLAQAGIAASVLVQNKDFSNKELLSIKDTDGVTAKFTYKDLYNRGYGRDLAGLVATALANNQAEVAINSLKSVEHKYLGEADLVKYGEGDSSINGFTANDLAQAGIAASVLVQNKDFSNEELLSIKDTDGVTAKFTYKDLYNRGYGRDLAELVTTSKARKEQIDAIDSLKSVNSKYLGNSKIAKSGFNASDLKTAGISASDVIDNSDFTSSELVGAGYTYKELFDNSSGRRLDDLITTSKARGEMDIAIDQLSTVQGKYLTQGELIYALPSASVMAVGGVTQDTFVNSLGYTEAEAKGFIATAKALTDNILLAAEGVTNELGPEKSLEFTYELRDAKVVPSATSTTFLDYKDKSQTALTSVAVRGDSIDSTSKYLLDIKVKNLEEDYDLESTDITIKYDKDLFDQIDQSQIRIGDAMPIANAVHIDNDNGEIRIAAGSINKLGKGKKIDHLGETTLATIAFNFNETNLEKHSTTNPGKKLFYSPPAEGDNLINEFKGNLSFSLEVNKDSTIFSKVDEAANNSTIKTLRDLAVDSAHVGGDFEVTGKPISLYEASMELSQDNQLYFGSERIIGVSSNSLKTNLIRAGDTVKTDISWKNTGNCHADDIKIESVGSNSLATLVEELSSISSTHLCGGEFDDSGQYVANDKSIDVSLAVRIESDSAGKVFDSSQHFYKLSVGSQSFDQGKGTKNLITFQGDLNYDGNVGMKDLAFLNAGARRQKIETGQTVASDTTYARDVDANFDGLISINDLSILDKDWGKTMHLGDNDFHGQGTATNQITWNELSSQNIEGTSSNQAHTWQNDSFEKQNSLESKAKSDGYDTPLGYRVINENSNPAPTVSDSNQDPDVVTYSDSALTTGLGSTSGDGDIQGTSLQDDIIGGSSIG
ncbi:hypothetical protein [Prochlorococcus marinus]|uniref:hypothetical protein n=1 Tax=Prochlorococcus marinus TaxID=1219 RepID=UPI0007B32CFF|nr:hypothetical protein [Prochlorococcus marinus]KZR77564.1 precorrin-8X methylmutase [Prochlorococcus marinus str. MIT 1323]